jgi:hypothetical protein
MRVKYSYINKKGIKMTKDNSPQRKPELSQAIEHMVTDGGESFLRYLKSTGLSTEPNILVLSPSQHYYYDESDLRSLRTLVNLKKLNLIRHLDSFLHNLYRILPGDSNFIGCFSDVNAHQSQVSHTGHGPGLFGSLRNFLDSMSEHRMTRTEVSELLKTHGFKVINMTEINGVTFFHSKNLRRSSERKAC